MMKADNEKLSALIDNEIIDEALLDELVTSEQRQAQFSRYHLIGDAMRCEVGKQHLNIDISQKVMAEINQQPSSATATVLDTSENQGSSQDKSNIISFVKRFGQYAIAASVAGIVVVTSLVTTPSVVENNDTGIEVLNTVPFGGGAAPVSLETTEHQSKRMIKERNERLEALLKDHQLQLQVQP